MSSHERFPTPEAGEKVYMNSAHINGSEGSIYCVEKDEKWNRIRVAIKWHYDNPCLDEFDESCYTSISYGTYHDSDDGTRSIHTNSGIWYFSKKDAINEKIQDLKREKESYQKTLDGLKNELSVTSETSIQRPNVGTPIYGYHLRSSKMVSYIGEILSKKDMNSRLEIVVTYSGYRNEKTVIRTAKILEYDIELKRLINLLGDERFFLNKKDMLNEAIKECTSKLDEIQKKLDKCREETIDYLLKEIHGRFVPTFYWENHDPMEYWYDPIKDAICVDSGDEKKIDLQDSELTYDSLFNLLDELENDLIKKYNLFTPDD